MRNKEGYLIHIGAVVFSGGPPNFSRISPPGTILAADPRDLRRLDSRALRPRFRKRGGSGGFNLVEMVLALGVLAVAVIPLMGLLPVGMATFRKAVDAALTTQISQRIVSEAQQTDFDTLISAGPSQRYFDGDGAELSGASGGVPAGTLYQVRVAVKSAPTLPGTAARNEYLATMTVQIAKNPGHQTLAVDPDSNLWDPLGNPGVPMASYSTVLAGGGSVVN